MAVLAQDTTLEAERFLVRQWARTTPAQIRQQMNLAWRFAQRLQDKEMSVAGPDYVTQVVLDALAQQGIMYLVGGSVASSLYGEARFTQDTDVLAEIDAPQAARLVTLLQEEFYGSEPAARDAVVHRSSFNLIHFVSNYKVDIFVSQNRPFERSRFSRRLQKPGYPDSFWFSSAEDVVLAKLEWYRQGRQLSDRQWRDVLAVLAVQHGRLDEPYLRRWAFELGLGDLLEAAWNQARPLTA